jgi:hypothetical protein
MVLYFFPFAVGEVNTHTYMLVIARVDRVDWVMSQFVEPTEFC